MPSLDQFDFANKNPFMDIVGGGMEQTEAPQAPQQAQAPQQPGMGGGEMEQEEDQINKGQNPDNSKNLISAIQALENYIKQSENREEIMTARGIIALLTRLVAMDQDSMSSKL